MLSDDIAEEIDAERRWEERGQMKFRKKPVEVEAMQFTGSNQFDLMRWCEQVFTTRTAWRFEGGCLFLPTKEGEMRADPGDWIIKEPFPTADRQFYPCKPSIFEATYEAIDMTPQPASPMEGRTR